MCSEVHQLTSVSVGNSVQPTQCLCNLERLLEGECGFGYHRGLGVVVCTHQLHQLRERLLGRLFGYHEVADKCICLRSSTTQEYGPLLFCGLHIFSYKMLSEALRVGLSVIEFADASVHGHSLPSSPNAV